MLLLCSGRGRGSGRGGGAVFLRAEGEEPSSDTKPGLQGLDVNVMVKQGPDAAEHSDIKKSYLLKQVCNVVSRTVIP